MIVNFDFFLLKIFVFVVVFLVTHLEQFCEIPSLSPWYTAGDVSAQIVFMFYCLELE